MRISKTVTLLYVLNTFEKGQLGDNSARAGALPTKNLEYSLLYSVATLLPIWLLAMSEIKFYNNKKSCDESSYHMGHIVFEHLQNHPFRICQIDAATGEEEINASVLKRSIQLASAIRTFGLNPGDVLALGGPNHLHICIPFYAGLFNGLPIVAVDPYYKYDEVRTLFRLTRPRIAFCQNESRDIYAKAAADLKLDLKLVTFNEGDCTMSSFIAMYGKHDDFKVAEYDLEKIYAFLISTSGTTGKVKVAAFKHRPVIVKHQWIYKKLAQRQMQPKVQMMLSPLNWISTYMTLIHAPVVGTARLQTSNPDDMDHYVEMINKYRPDVTLIPPTFMIYLISRKNDVDLTCFQSISIIGSKVYVDVLTEFKTLLSKNCWVFKPYGQTESIGPILAQNPFGPINNCGVPMDLYSIKLVDPNTGADIKEANITGEMVFKGPSFTEYYNDLDETSQSFTEDGFFKSGDLLYRDEQHNYFFVDRIKTLIKYQNFHVLPLEIEEVIMEHPGVKDICVMGVDDPADGQRAAACVVRHEGCDVTAQEIRDLVIVKLSKKKELRGGVVFIDALPYTSTGKVARGKVKALVMESGFSGENK